MGSEYSPLKSEVFCSFFWLSKEEFMVSIHWRKLGKHENLSRKNVIIFSPFRIFHYSHFNVFLSSLLKMYLKYKLFFYNLITAASTYWTPRQHAKKLMRIILSNPDHCSLRLAFQMKELRLREFKYLAQCHHRKAAQELGVEKILSPDTFHCTSDQEHFSIQNGVQQ